MAFPVRREGQSDAVNSQRPLRRSTSAFIGYAALRSDHRPVSHREVAGGANLAGEDAVAPNFGRASKADLPAEHGVGTDSRSVTNQDEVIELGAAADARFADGGAVDASVCLNFDIIFQHGGSGLRHFVPRTIFLFCETQAVPTDDRTILQDYAIADAAEFAHYSVRMSKEIIANLRPSINCHEAVQNGVAADLDVFVHVTIRADVGSILYFCASRDDCRWMNP